MAEMDACPQPSAIEDTPDNACAGFRARSLPITISLMLSCSQLPLCAGNAELAFLQNARSGCRSCQYRLKYIVYNQFSSPFGLGA